jgi:hypothetical protein
MGCMLQHNEHNVCFMTSKLEKLLHPCPNRYFFIFVELRKKNSLTSYTKNLGKVHLYHERAFMQVKLLCVNSSCENCKKNNDDDDDDIER